MLGVSGPRRGYRSLSSAIENKIFGIEVLHISLFMFLCVLDSQFGTSNAPG